MIEIIERLYKLLKNEFELYQKLEKTAGKKRDAITENDVERLAEVIEDEDELIEKLEDDEKERNQLVERLADYYGLAEDFQYSNLIKNFPQEWQKKFDLLRTNLLETIDEIDKLNEENSLLLEEAIKINKFSLDMLSKAISPENGTYNKKQSGNKRKQNYNIIDRKV